MIKHFLLIFDRAQWKLLDTIAFGSNGKAALERYGELESEHFENAAMDIVLVGSDSLETIKITHANYFYEGDIMARLKKDLGEVGEELRRTVAR